MKAADPALKVGAIFFRLAFARLEFNDPSFVSASELLSSTVQAVSSDSMHVAGETVGITQSRGHCAASFSLLLSRRENARDTSSKDPLYSADAGTGATCCCRMRMAASRIFCAISSLPASGMAMASLGVT